MTPWIQLHPANTVLRLEALAYSTHSNASLIKYRLSLLRDPAGAREAPSSLLPGCMLRSKPGTLAWASSTHGCRKGRTSGAHTAACRPPARSSGLRGGAGRPLWARVLQGPLLRRVLRRPLRLRWSLHAAPMCTAQPCSMATTGRGPHQRPIQGAGPVRIGDPNVNDRSVAEACTVCLLAQVCKKPTHTHHVWQPLGLCSQLCLELYAGCSQSDLMKHNQA